jgi:hypothetical protein
MTGRPQGGLRTGHRGRTWACADQDQPNPGRLSQILPARHCAACLRHAGQLHLVAADPHAARPAPLEVQGRPPPVHHARGQWLPVMAGDIAFKRISAIPSPGIATAAARSQPLGSCLSLTGEPRRARCAERHTADSARGSRKRPEQSRHHALGLLSEARAAEVWPGACWLAGHFVTVSGHGGTGRWRTATGMTPGSR